jgi:ribosomal protein S18 acetylase RimI-like enzyme
MIKVIKIKETKPILITNSLLWKKGIDQRICLVEKKYTDELLLLEGICYDPLLYGDFLLTKSKIYHIINHANAIILLIHISNKLAGYIQLAFKSTSNKMNIESIAVHPSFRSNGIAKLLMINAEKLFLFMGVNTMTLEVRQDKKYLRDFYEKVGFVSYKIVKDYYHDGCSCIKMKKTRKF